MRRVALVVFMALSALAASGFVAPAAHALDSPDPALVTVTLTNTERHAHGLGPLGIADDLQVEAQRHADDMAAAGALWHTADLGSRVGNWKRLGENVGRGPSPEAIHAGFMNSPTHRANVLQPAYTQIGVGTSITADGRVYISVLYRLPSNVRVATHAFAAPARRPVTTSGTATKPTVPVQVAGATVTRPAPVEPVKQLASGAIALHAEESSNTRNASLLLAAALLAMVLAAHATLVASRRPR